MASDRPDTPTAATSLLGHIGIVLYAATAVLYLASGLVVPYPWVFGMWALWLGGIYLLVRVYQTRPAWTAAVAVAAVLAWAAIVQTGTWLFDWTA